MVRVFVCETALQPGGHSAFDNADREAHDQIATPLNCCVVVELSLNVNRCAAEVNETGFDVGDLDVATKMLPQNSDEAALCTCDEYVLTAHVRLGDEAEVSAAKGEWCSHN